VNRRLAALFIAPILAYVESMLDVAPAPLERQLDQPMRLERTCTMASYLPGKFVWFEHVSHDLPKARAFYEPLFGWHVERMPMGAQSYDMILNGNTGIGGLRSAPTGATSHWASYVSVLDVDASYAAALAAGAKGLSAPLDHGPVGRGATIADPTGAPLSLWKGTDGDPPDVDDTPTSGWIWNELWTPDVKKALAFYERLLGYSRDSMDMGEQGTYYLLKTGDKSRGGVIQSSDPSASPMWLPYVKVADCDVSAGKAKKLGGQTLVPPTDIPTIGRFAILLDTVGAAVAIIKPEPMSS